MSRKNENARPRIRTRFRSLYRKLVRIQDRLSKAKKSEAGQAKFEPPDLIGGLDPIKGQKI